MSNLRYIEITSASRDRTRFPNPSCFDIQLSQTGIKSTGLTALDPILDGFPIHPVPGAAIPVFAAGTTNTNPVLDATASSISNFYIGDILEDINNTEFRTITAYDGGTQTATVDLAFTAAAPGDSFKIRKERPCEQGTAAAGSTLTTFVLPLGSSSMDNFYTGKFISITSGPAAGDVRLIISYVGFTRTGTVAPPFSANPTGDLYEILSFTRDNVSPLNYTGSDVSQQQMVCYEVELITLILPNVLLFSGQGGLPSFLPTLFVEFSNITGASGRNKNIIYSNNPNITRALFKAPMDDVPTPIIASFLKIDGDGMIQTIKFKPNDNFHFSVFLECGELFLTRPDNFSPRAPNPELQISATFSIKRL